MKKINTILFLVLASFMIFGCAAPKRDYSNLPDEELYKEEAVVRIQQFQSSVQDLTSKSNMQDQELQAMRNNLDQTNAAIKNCRDSYYSLLGATDADIEAYRQKLGALEGKVRQMQRLSDEELAEKNAEIKALDDELNQLRMNKIAVLPEFYNKIIQLARDIKGLYREKKIKSYTVGTWSENRDCLWNIAGKADIYGDPFQWPKIWQGNTDQIKNPDIIHPGQVLQLPPPGPKTPEEMKAERKYWRMKRAAMEKEAAEPKKGE